MINDAGKHEVKPSRRGAPKLKVLPVEGLSGQVSDIDGVNVYGRRVGVRGSDGRGRRATHVMSIGARIVVETGGDRFIAWLLREATPMPPACGSTAAPS